MAGNIWCLGRSYAAHAEELGNEIPKSPLIFLKASGCLLEGQNELVLPNKNDEIHHEVEMCLKLNESLVVSHYAVAIDLTNRTQQSILKSKGQPWTLAKSFIGSCPVGPWVSAENVDLKNLDISLHINDAPKQNANTELLLFEIDFLIDYLKQNYPLQAGDLIMTGTPAGVGPIQSGDKITAKLGESVSSWQVR